MRYFALPDGVINRKDRAQWLTTPFDLPFNPILQNVSQNLTLTQTVATRNILNKTVRQTFLQSQELTISLNGKTNSIQHALLLQDSVEVKQITGNKIRERTISQPILLMHSISVNKILNKTIQHTIPLVHVLQRNRFLPQIIQQTIGIKHHIVHRIDHTIPFVSTASAQKVVTLNIQQNLLLQQTLQRLLNLNLSLSHVLIFNDPYLEKVQIGNLTIKKPAAIASLISRKCRLRLVTNRQSIILPCPQFGDIENNNSSIITKRTMNGSLYSYVRNLTSTHLSYNIVMDRAKSLELRQFILDNLTEPVTIYDWKGHVWLSFIATNPADITISSRADPMEERANINLEFQAHKIV